ncbi:MAG: nitroreductase [Firmicutes bacterium]|nr:nitroreductase [Bacillota bacterium]
MDSIFIRRSVRKYLNQPVESEKVEQLLKAAMQAPSAGNQQPWEFIVVQDKKLLSKLSLLSPYAGPINEAAVAIVMLGNKENVKFPEYLQQDLSAATQNLLLQAVELDLGAVWLGVAPIEERMKYIMELFDLPESIMPFAVIPIGYPETENKYIDRYEKVKVHYGRY